MRNITGRKLRNVYTVNEYLSLRNLFLTEKQLCHSGLSRTRMSYDEYELAVVNMKADI